MTFFWSELSRYGKIHLTALAAGLLIVVFILLVSIIRNLIDTEDVSDAQPRLSPPANPAPSVAPTENRSKPTLR